MKKIKQKDLLNATYKKLINKLLNTSEAVDVAHVLDILQSHKGVCEYTGETLKIENVSIERVDPFKGYVRGNVVLITEPINKTKGTTLDMFAKNDRISLDMRIKAMEKTLQSMRKIRREEEEKALEAKRLAEEKLKTESIDYLVEQLKSMTPAQLATVVKVYQAEQQKK